MSDVDWSRLAPHRLPEPEEHVTRPTGSGERLALLVKRGLVPIAVIGPSGAGKSTEIDVASRALADFATVLRFNVRDLVPSNDLAGDTVVFGLAEKLLERMIEIDETFKPGQGLVRDVRASNPRFPRGNGTMIAPPLLVRLCMIEVLAHTHREKIVVFIEGLEESSTEAALGSLRGLWQLVDTIPVVAIVPASLAHGPAAHEVTTAMRPFAIPAIDVEDPAQLAFLHEIVRRRIGVDQLPDKVLPILDSAARISGGLVRTYLQIVADAALYAGGEPTREALDEAIRDRIEAARRVLVEGDAEALNAAEGTSGLEVPLEKRVRLLEQGLLLEYARGTRTVVRAHPLLADILADAKRPKKAPKAPARRARKG